MRRLTRSRIALLLTVIYSLITVSPLAPLASHSTVIVPVVSGECSGDCAICGCAPEQSAAQTCCCAKKKALELEQAGDHCTRTPVLSCRCPRGGENPPLLWDTDNLELLPYHFSGDILAFHEGNLSSLYSGRRADRHDTPPDPPPKFAMIS